MNRGWLCFAALCLALCATSTALAQQDAAAGISTQEQRGRFIYETGTSPTDGTITAVLGGGQTKVPAALFPCAKCHGENGRGGEEGGVVAADITWHALTKPYEVRRSDRRTRPPYDRDALIVRAFSLGMDAGGARLNQVMPRYEMSREDAVSLVAYLKVLGEAAEPGVTDASVSIGLIAPPADSEGQAKSAMHDLLIGYFEQVNAAGGVYGRRIEPVVFTLPREAKDTGPALEAFLNDRQPLAFVAPYMALPRQDIRIVLDAQQIPVVAVRPPQGLLGPSSRGLQFFALPGLLRQSRSLAAFAKRIQTEANAAVAIAHGGGAAWTEAAKESADVFGKNGLIPPDLIELTPAQNADEVVRRLLDRRASVLVLLAPAPLGASLVRALTDRRHPMVILSLEREMAAFSGLVLHPGSRLFLSRPTLPNDVTTDAFEILQALADKMPDQGAYSDDVLGALAAAAVLIEGLRSSGRAVTRGTLAASIEALYRFPSGFVRPLTFGPNRKVGTDGAYVIEYDIRTGRPTGKHWVEAE